MKNNLRDPAIELYRMMLMFGICLLHCTAQGEFSKPWLVNLLLSCVCGFVFVSGWFGVRFSFKKIIRLYGMAVYAAAICSLSLLVISPTDMDYRDVPVVFVKLFKGYWFLNAYVLMMCLAPIVDKALDSCGDRRESWHVVSPLIGAALLWGYAFEIPYLKRLVPFSEGLGAYTGLTLLASYTAARLCRKFIAEPKLSHIILFFVVSGVVVVLTGGSYHSPFSVTLAASAFMLIRKVRISNALARIIAVVNPSLFVVYMLHSRELVGFPLIRAFEGYLAKMLPKIGGGAIIVLSAIVVFGVCLALDVPRRLFGAGVTKIKGHNQ